MVDVPLVHKGNNYFRNKTYVRANIINWTSLYAEYFRSCKCLVYKTWAHVKRCYCFQRNTQANTHAKPPHIASIALTALPTFPKRFPPLLLPIPSQRTHQWKPLYATFKWRCYATQMSAYLFHRNASQKLWLSLTSTGENSLQAIEVAWDQLIKLRAIVLGCYAMYY